MNVHKLWAHFEWRMKMGDKRTEITIEKQKKRRKNRPHFERTWQISAVTENLEEDDFAMRSVCKQFSWQSQFCRFFLERRMTYAAINSIVKFAITWKRQNKQFTLYWNCELDKILIGCRKFKRVLFPFRFSYQIAHHIIKFRWQTHTFICKHTYSIFMQKRSVVRVHGSSEIKRMAIIIMKMFLSFFLFYLLFGFPLIYFYGELLPLWF